MIRVDAERFSIGTTNEKRARAVRVAPRRWVRLVRATVQNPPQTSGPVASLVLVAGATWAGIVPTDLQALGRLERSCPGTQVVGVKVARELDPEMLFLSAEEVERIAAAIREPYGTLVYLLAYGGLRWGEAVAVRRKRCGLLRSRIEVTESLSEARGMLHFGSTKTYRSRMVILPAFLSELLAEHLAREVDDSLDALVFTSLLGKPLRNSNFRRQVWYKAVADVGTTTT